MDQVMVKEKDKLTDRLEGILADIRYLEHDDPTIAVDTLDGCVAQCAEILTRIKRLRRWVRMDAEDGVPLAPVEEAVEGVDYDTPVLDFGWPID